MYRRVTSPLPAFTISVNALLLAPPPAHDVASPIALSPEERSELKISVKWLKRIYSPLQPEKGVMEIEVGQDCCRKSLQWCRLEALSSGYRKRTKHSSGKCLLGKLIGVMGRDINDGGEDPGHLCHLCPGTCRIFC